MADTTALDPKQSEAADEAEASLAALFADAPGGVEFKKLRKRLLRQARDAIETYGMVRPGARWLVALSGGKDSYGLLAILMELKYRGLLPVELLACNLDQGQPGFPKHVLPDYLARIGVEHRIEYQDTYSIVTEKVPAHQTYCAMCSRLRRGHLYRIAREEGCEALVLGHHREDILETFFMNLFHGGRLAGMPPKLLNDEGDVTVLRPLSFCAEPDLQKFSDGMQFPIIPCNLCGTQEGLQREATKRMLNQIEAKNPGRKDTMIRALANVRPSHLLDTKLFDFTGLTPDA
ncbi:tRNA 2-thiocytidine(32) synthetase TtcA [Cucumibacter marinus]|uniref:tRNA 2-thiocytidine(32) synthetase TtcA n=1 Tax=Cucumibacter marinus TaxID=1121252 RepID=UPI00048BACFB